MTAANARKVRCPKCNAQPLTACKRVKPGRKVEVQYLAKPHPERVAAAALAAEADSA